MKFKTTNGYTVRVSKRDYKAVTKHRWYAKPTGHVIRKSGRKTIYLHRQILGAQKGEIVDHVDRDPLNNTRENIRIASGGQNRANSKKMLRQGQARSRFKGVTRIGGKRRKKPWQAYANKKYLGTFATEQEAAAAYDAAVTRLFGKFACTNAMLRAA